MVQNHFDIPVFRTQAVTNVAVLKAILARTKLSLWMASDYMPRTRDMSHSRRTLLRARCRKVLGTTDEGEVAKGQPEA